MRARRGWRVMTRRGRPNDRDESRVPSCRVPLLGSDIRCSLETPSDPITRDARTPASQKVWTADP